MEVEFSNHALKQIEARKIPKDLLLEIIHQPDKIVQIDNTIHLFIKLIREREKSIIFIEYILM